MVGSKGRVYACKNVRMYRKHYTTIDCNKVVYVKDWICDMVTCLFSPLRASCARRDASTGGRGR